MLSAGLLLMLCVDAATELSRTSEVAWAWRVELGSRGCLCGSLRLVVQTSLSHQTSRSSPPPPELLHSIHIILQSDKTAFSTLLFNLPSFSPSASLILHYNPVITTNTQDGCHQAGACHQQKLQHLHSACHIYMMKINDSP